MTMTNVSTTNGRWHNDNTPDEHLLMHDKHQNALNDLSPIELWTVYCADIQPFIQTNITTHFLVCTTKLTGNINDNLTTIFSRIQHLHKQLMAVTNFFHLPSFYNRTNTLGTTAVSFQTMCPNTHMTYNIHFHYPKIGTISIDILFIIHVSIKFFLNFRKIIPILSPQEIAHIHRTICY